MDALLTMSRRPVSAVAKRAVAANAAALPQATADTKGVVGIVILHAECPRGCRRQSTGRFPPVYQSARKLPIPKLPDLDN
jgi:hypothetical protein